MGVDGKESREEDEELERRGGEGSVARPVPPSRRPPPAPPRRAPYPPPCRALCPSSTRSASPPSTRAASPPSTRAASVPSPRARVLPTALPLPGRPPLPSRKASCLTSLQAPSPPLMVRLLLPLLHHLLLLPSPHPPPLPPPPLFIPSSLRASPPFLHLLPLRICHLATCHWLPLGDRDPTSSSHSAPSPSSSSSLSLYFPHHLTSSSASLLSLSAAAGSSAEYLPSIPPPLLSPHLCSITIPSPSWRLFSLLPLFLCASALTLFPPYLLSYPCLLHPPPPPLHLPPFAPPLLHAAGPPLFSTPPRGFRCPISVAALLPSTLLPLSPLVLVLWPLLSA
ncbi:unnamed protein product [Closterium sp. Naga37s-1]|nr:unnamed protein product [Closterium sp. Naga37s-1]